MKRHYLSVLLAPLFSTAALAAGGYTGPGATPQDASGSIKVEIDDEDWPAQAIDQQVPVRLTGEVDRDLLGREIDVEFVERVD